MKKLLLLLIVGGVGFVLCAVMGYVNVPGLTPQPSPAPQADKIEQPPATPPAEKPLATGAKKEEEKPAPSSAESLKPAAPRPPVKRYPAIQSADLERARSLYARADWAGVARALEGCEKPDIEDGPSTQAARMLVRKARLLDALTQKFARNKLATAKTLEQVSLNSGGTMIGVVTDLGDRIKIYRMGNVEAEVKKDDVSERTPVRRDALLDKLHERLKDKEARIKADDAFGNMRLGHFCWQYALDREAVPYLDKAVESDDFPVLAKVFAGSAADRLVDDWYAMSGKARPGAAGPSNVSAPPPPASSGEPSRPASGGVANVALARSKYDQGVEHYKSSFGDSDKARAELKAAHELFKAARDALGDSEDAALDELRMQISRLLYDCSKRSAIN